MPSINIDPTTIDASTTATVTVDIPQTPTEAHEVRLQRQGSTKAQAGFEFQPEHDTVGLEGSDATYLLSVPAPFVLDDNGDGTFVLSHNG